VAEGKSSFQEIIKAGLNLLAVFSVCFALWRVTLLIPATSDSLVAGRWLLGLVAFLLPFGILAKFLIGKSAYLKLTIFVVAQIILFLLGGSVASVQAIVWAFVLLALIVIYLLIKEGFSKITQRKNRL